MKYSYSIVFVVLICYQVLSILATSELKEQPKSLLRNKRQAYRPGLGSLFKRNEYNRNYEGEELDEPELSSSNGSNQKREKSKSFVSWGGKRSASPSAKQGAQQRANINGYLAATNSLNTIKREKPGFRSWGGKRSLVEPLNSKLNDYYLKRLEALDMLLNELDSQNYD